VTYIEKIIKEKGPILSSELLESLMNNEKTLSNDAARKRLSRTGSNVFSVRGMFANGQKLFFHRDIYQKEEYYLGLREALEKAGKQYNTILKSLEYHFGSISAKHLASYSNNPINKLKGHLLFQSALIKLKDLNLVRFYDDYIHLSEDITDKKINHRYAKGVEIAKSFILLQFNDWARKIGMISYNSSKFHSDFGGYQFNLVAPSYIASLTKFSSNTIIPAFVIADILIGNTINGSDVDFFINKINVLKSQKNLANFIPILIVDSIENEALNKLKSHGIIIGFTEQLFGSEYKDLLDSLINLVTNAGAILKKNPEAYLDLMNKLNKLVDGKTNNLRGDLFEFAVGYYHGQLSKSIDISKSIIFEGLQREIDVLSVYQNNITISECKGYNKQASKEDIEIWLGEKVPIIRKWLLSQNLSDGKEIIFEYWSTGGFTPEANSLLIERKSSTKKYTIITYNLDEMIFLAKKNRLKKFTEVLRNYYTKEL
jgi:hypothetical protein